LPPFDRQDLLQLAVELLVTGDPKKTELNARSHESSMRENLVSCEA
jgi:hypothetical protein